VRVSATVRTQSRHAHGDNENTLAQTIVRFAADAITDWKMQPKQKRIKATEYLVVGHESAAK
jgi:hypothetical protein